jgi:CubicO group peptidase (beta-lactamase class C family)
MLTQPIQFPPGERTAYSNFGYCVLGRVIEKVYRKTYFDCVRADLCQPLGIRDVRLGYSDSKKRDPREVCYPIPDDTFRMEVMDAHGGLIASAPAVARFLQTYWVTGEPRRTGQRQNWWAFGSLPGTTALARQRDDGLNAVVLMNGRRNDSFEKDNDKLVQALDGALDRVSKKKAPKPCSGFPPLGDSHDHPAGFPLLAPRHCRPYRPGPHGGHLAGRLRRG